MFFCVLPAEAGIDTSQQDGCVWKHLPDLLNCLLDTRIPVGHQGCHHHDIGLRYVGQVFPKPFQGYPVSRKIPRHIFQPGRPRDPGFQIRTAPRSFLQGRVFSFWGEIGPGNPYRKYRHREPAEWLPTAAAPWAWPRNHTLQNHESMD